MTEHDKGLGRAKKLTLLLTLAFLPWHVISFPTLHPLLPPDTFPPSRLPLEMDNKTLLYIHSDPSPPSHVCLFQPLYHIFSPKYQPHSWSCFVHIARRMEFRNKDIWTLVTYREMG